jgi:hypothetical protein
MLSCRVLLVEKKKEEEYNENGLGKSMMTSTDNEKQLIQLIILNIYCGTNSKNPDLVLL